MATIREIAMAVGRKVLDELPNNRYWNQGAHFSDRYISDKDVYDFAIEHMRFRDKINARKITEAVLMSFAILSGAAEESKEKNWKFEW